MKPRRWHNATDDGVVVVVVVVCRPAVMNSRSNADCCFVGLSNAADDAGRVMMMLCQCLKNAVCLGRELLTRTAETGEDKTAYP